MSQSMTLTEAITAADGLFDAGDPIAARREFAYAVAEIAQPEDIALMMQIVQVFEGDFYDVALNDLRALWKSRLDDREMFELCRPHTDPKLFCPTSSVPRTVPVEDGDEGSVELLTTAREPGWFFETDEAIGPSRVRLEHREEFYRRPRKATKEAAPLHPERLEARRAARRPWVEERRAVLEYFLFRFMRDDDPEHLPVREDTDTPATLPAYSVKREDPVGYGIDYDKASMYPVVGWRCVSCFGERAVADARPVDPSTGARRSDDGLCDSCRDAGIAGVPALDPGYGWQEQVRAFCCYLTSTYRGSVGALLRDQYRRSPHHVQDVIAACVMTRPLSTDEQVLVDSILADDDDPAVDESLQTSAV